MAGLTAARKLAEAHRHVMVLEARNRVGGRIFTLRERNEVLELGAEFIHGRPPELWRLIQEADLETYQVDGTHVCHKDGKIQKSDVLESTFKFLDALESRKWPDFGFADFPPLKVLSPDAEKLILAAGLDPTARAETLSVADFAALARVFFN